MTSSEARLRAMRAIPGLVAEQLESALFYVKMACDRGEFTQNIRTERVAVVNELRKLGYRVKRKWFSAYAMPEYTVSWGHVPELSDSEPQESEQAETKQKDKAGEDV
jgi:hypothetical protein